MILSFYSTSEDKLVQLTVNHTQNKTLVTVLFEQQWARSYMFRLMRAIIRRTKWWWLSWAETC